MLCVWQVKDSQLRPRLIMSPFSHKEAVHKMQFCFGPLERGKLDYLVKALMTPIYNSKWSLPSELQNYQVSVQVENGLEGATFKWNLMEIQCLRSFRDFLTIFCRLHIFNLKVMKLRENYERTWLEIIKWSFIPKSCN